MKNILIYVFAIFLFSQISFANEINKVRLSQGNLLELNRAFEKLPKTDGTVAEDLSIAIGKSITKHPRNFLKSYQRHKATVTRLDAVLGNLGPEFVDDFKAQSVELNKRITALKSVKNKNLESLAQECISVLQKKLKAISP